MRDPESATITVERPADFDEFWADTFAGLPDPAPELTRVPRLSTDRVDTFDVRFTSYQGVRIAAWFCAPRDAQGPLPGILNIPGYISEPMPPRGFAERGYAALAIAPRGKLRSNDVFNPGYPGLLTHDIADHHTYGYRGFYVDTVRALDVLATLPGVDPARLGVQGSSQGGGLGVVTAALRPELVKAVACGAPYLCGIRECTRLTRSYPYEEIREFLHVHPSHEDDVWRTVAYYDGLNFAPAVRAPILIYIGLRDDVCPPESGFALHRVLTAPKELHTFPHSGHHAGLHWIFPKVEAFLDQHLEPLS
jgi:cephalosporin-C deacetylase